MDFVFFVCLSVCLYLSLIYAPFSHYRLTPVQSLELLLATSTDSHNAELLRVDLGTKVDEVVAGGEKLCEQLGHTPMAVALAGSLVRWKQTHQRSDFWFNECAEQLRERVEAVAASLGPSSSSYPSSTLALVATADLLAEEILSAGQSPDYQQAAHIQSLGRHSYSSDTMVRENLAALGWLAADAAPVAVAFLRKHMQNPDFDLERAREQQLLQQRQQLEAMEKVCHAVGQGRVVGMICFVRPCAILRIRRWHNAHW